MEDIPERNDNFPERNDNELGIPTGMTDTAAVSVTIIEDSEAEVTPAKQKKKRERPPPDPTDPAVIAAKAAEHNKAAEAEAEALKDAEEGNQPSRLEECKYYTSLLLGTFSIVSVFAFLFLVPFVLDPAISTLRHDFVDDPVTCKVTNVSVKEGKSQCKWSSCREGCTADMYHCVQVRVQYAKVPYKNGTNAKSISDNEWVDLRRIDVVENKTMDDTPLLVNIKGCGYPPEIACALFASRYNATWYKHETFPCYYSKVNPWIVLETYNPSEMIGSIIASVTIPNVIFVISLIVLLYWYCPYCQAKFHKYDEQIDQEGHEDDDDELDLDEDEEHQDRF